MSRTRVSVGNLIHHTSQSTGGPISVQSPQTAAPAPSPQRHPQLQVYRYYEHGREYYAVNGGIVYPFPCDEDEDDGLDFFHALVHDVALNKRLHVAEINDDDNPQPRRMLDVGHGTGIWVYEKAAIEEHAEVVGIDLHSRTPVREGGGISNASFATPVDFLQPEWPFPLDSHDLIRMSQLCGSVPDWSSLYHTVSRYLKPGNGYVDHIELDWTPRSMDGFTFPDQANELFQWYRSMQEASRRFGKPIDCPTHVEQLMERCGLADISHTTIRISLRPRKDDERDHKLSWAFKLLMSEPLDNGRVPRTFESLSMSLFTRQLGMQPQAVLDLCTRLRAIVSTPELPIYFNLHVWTARRPKG